MGADQPSVVIIATSPDHVQFRSDAQDVVVPLRRAPLPAASPRRATVMQGMLIGAAIGVIAGAMQGAERDKWAAAHPEAHCDPFSCGGNRSSTPRASARWAWALVRPSVASSEASRVHDWRDRLPPGPRGSVVQMLRYARDPLGFYADCARRFGDVFTIPTVLGPIVVCGDPEGVRSIFALPPESFSRWSTDSVSPLLGEASLLLSGGARHARDRKLLTPPFHGERMRAYGAVIRAAALREAASWAPGSAFSMQEAGSAISIDVILRAVFGVDEAAGLDELRAALLGALASMSPLLMLFPALRRRFGGIGPYARMLRVRDRLDALTYDAIARRRARAVTAAATTSSASC